MKLIIFYKFIKPYIQSKIFIDIKQKNSMQQQEGNALYQWLQKLHLQLTAYQKLSSIRSKQYLDSIKKQIIHNHNLNIHPNSLYLILIIINLIEEKTLNLNQKITTEIWKLFLSVLYQLNQSQKSQQHSKWLFLNENYFVTKEFYKKIFNHTESTQKQNNKNNKITATQKYSDLISQIWSKTFKYTNLRSFQNSFLCFFISWDYLFTQNTNKKQSTLIHGSLQYLQKCCMFLIKFIQRIKQSETFQQLIALLVKIKQKFQITYEKQLSASIKALKSKFKLTQTINFSNPYQNVWQKIILATVVCMSKKMNLKNQQIFLLMKMLQNIRNTSLIQRLINFCRNYRYDNKKINKRSIIISAQQLQYVLYSTMVGLWINTSVMKQSIKQQQLYQSYKLSYTILSKNQQISAKIEKQQQKQNIVKRIDQLRKQILEYIRILVKRQISALMVRQLIRRLQTVNDSFPVNQWKQIFAIMSLLLKQYPKNRSVIQFQDDDSYISKKFSSPIKFPFTIHLKLKGESIPFKQQKILMQFSDSQNKQKIWITMRNYQKDIVIFSIVKIKKNDDVQGKYQKQFLNWSQYEANNIQIVLKSNRIKIIVNNDDSINFSTDVALKKVDQIVLCDRQTGMGSAISQLFHFKLIQYTLFQQQQKVQTDFVNLIDPKISQASKLPMKQGLTFYKCQKVSQQSFVHYTKILGDLQLFVFILYQVLKKIKLQKYLLQMIRGILQIMQQFTVCKQVQHKQLSQQQKQIRRNTILCLCWFYAKQTRSPTIILQLMRFLNIRQNKNSNQQYLKFLCNFSYWRQFKLQSQQLIMMKIRQLFKQSSKQEQKLYNLKFCKKILFDMVLFLKQSHYVMSQKQNCLKLHKVVFQTVYQLIKDILEHSGKKQKHFMLQIFYFIEFLIKLTSSILNRKISQDAFDITFAIQLTLFLRDLSKLIFISKERKHIYKSDIDVSIELYFKKQEQQLVLPLGLNMQDTNQQRFNIFLTKIMSQTKSLMQLFEQQTRFIQQNQIRIYPIYSEQPLVCNENKVNSNVVSFNIYMSMLGQKSWNYLLFAMPLSQYNQRLLESIWRICFFELSKQNRYYMRISKMLDQTPFPQSDYCLMKIFQAVLFNSIYQKQNLYRLLKSQNFYKSICPFKLQNLIIKFINKLQPQVIDTTDQTEYSMIQAQSSITKSSLQNSKQIGKNKQIFQQQKIYYVLFHNKRSQYQSTKQIIQCLKHRKMYDSYKVIIYHIVIKSLVKFSKSNYSNASLKHFDSGEKELSPCINKTDKFMQSAIIDVSLTKRTSNTYKDILQPMLSVIQESGNQSILEQQTQKVSLNQSQLVQPIYKQQTSSTKRDFIFLALQTLSYFKSQITSQNIKQFNQLNLKQDIQAHVQNFLINIQGIIKGLEIIKSTRQTKQFDKFQGFIQVHLTQFSQFNQVIIYKKFPFFKSSSQNQGLNSHEQPISPSPSKKLNSRNKYLYKTVHVDLVKHSTDFFLQIMGQRRQQLHNLQQIWNEVQKKNKFYWNIFYSNQKYYSLSDITTSLGERLLLTISNDKPKIQLPKMISKQSLLNSISLISDKNEGYDQSESSALFDQSQIFVPDFEQPLQSKNKQKNRKGSINYATKQIKTKKYRILMITNSKIYQGFLYMADKYLMKFQQTYTTDLLYDRICANPQERRTDEQIQRQPKNIDIVLSNNSQITQIFFRKYLFYDIGIQIYSYQKSHFFCFQSPQKRNKFLSVYFKDHPGLINYQKSKKIILDESAKWINGLLSNYQYLMMVNKFANRSPNDMSQYYVMPWTIFQFEKKDIDKSYIFKFQNFRDLRKPLGKVFDKKWKQIQTKFNSSFGSLIKNKQMAEISFGQPFMYGSFYSNPAIVTNYMIRLQPFSSMHFHLQSQKIDVADRLFFQFSDQYRSIMTNLSDTKQLIPQFYNNPQFLKNKSKLNLGARQNKQIVNDVRLPKWAESAVQFVFKMKYFLQCPLISKYLNGWIDLIFGIKAKKQNALEADNLFMSDIYGPKQDPKNLNKNKNQQKRKSNQNNSAKKSQMRSSKNSSLVSQQGRIPINKQFGQIPLSIFDNQHPQFIMRQEYYFFNGITQVLFSHPSSSQFQEKNNQLLIRQNFGLTLIGKTLHMYEIQPQDSKQNWKTFQQLCSMQILQNPKIILGKKLGALLPYIFYIKKDKRKLYSRYIKKTKLFSKLQLKEEFEICDCDIYDFLNDEVLIIGQKNLLKIYSFQQSAVKYESSQHSTSSKNNFGSKITMFKIQQTKPAFSAKQFPYFTQHRAQIILITVNNDLNIILSLDQMNKIFLIKYYPDKLEVINNFQVKSLHFQEKITQIILHKMSLIICLTSYNRIVSYNFYGQLIGAKQIVFKPTLITKTPKQNVKQEKDLKNVKKSFSQSPKNLNQHLTCLNLFNKQTSQLLIGTNHGNLWKIDLFQFYKSQQQISVRQLWFQKISLNTNKQKYSIKDIKIKRNGRHWQIYCLSYDENNRKIIKKVKCLTLKNISFNLNK